MAGITQAPIVQRIFDQHGIMHRTWLQWFNQAFESIYRAERFRAVYYDEANGDLADQVFLIADRGMKVEAIREVHSVAGTHGSAVTLQVTKDTGTAAPGSGTSLLSSALSLKAAANTVQTGTLSATATDLELSAGDRLAVNFTGTLTSVAGVCVIVVLRVT